MEAFNISDALNIGLAKSRKEYWEEYRDSPIRQSQWQMENNLIPIPQLTTQYIRSILKTKFTVPLPLEWRELFQKELEFRQVDWFFLDQLEDAENAIRIGIIRIAICK